MAELYPNEPQNDDENSKKNSNIRSIISQTCAVLAITLVKFVIGTSIGFRVILIAELYKKNSEIEASLDELTWFSSLNFVAIIGSALSGFIIQSIGCRLLLILAAIYFFLLWLVFYYAKSIILLIITEVLRHFTIGTVRGPGVTFISELCQPHLRGIFMSFTNLFIALGSFFSVLLGNFMHWRTIALINLLFPAISVVAIFAIPESPYWLASKNKFQEAERALSWLRGWVKPDQVKFEFDTLCQVYKKQPQIVPNSKNDKNLQMKQKFKAVMEPYRQRSFYIPLAFTVFMFFIRCFSYLPSMHSFSMLIFQMINSPIDEHVATSIFELAHIMGALICTIIISFIGRRKVIFISLIGSSLCLFISSLTIYLINQKIIVSPFYLWVSPVMMMLIMFLYALGLEKVLLYTNSEIFPEKLRHIGAGLGVCIEASFASIANKSFLYIVMGITLPGVFLYSALLNIFGFVVFYFVYPETEGKSLREIEDHYSGDQKLKKRDQNSLNKI